MDYWIGRCRVGSNTSLAALFSFIGVAVHRIWLKDGRNAFPGYMFITPAHIPERFTDFYGFLKKDEEYVTVSREELLDIQRNVLHLTSEGNTPARLMEHWEGMTAGTLIGSTDYTNIVDVATGKSRGTYGRSIHG